MIYKYLRFSTDKQDEKQQENTIDKFLEIKGMKSDATITDSGVSGGVSYDRRNLGDLCKSLSHNDVVVVSEVSRLTRSGIGELSYIIEKHFKPNKLRLIICNVGLDIDCSDINPMIELQLAMMATFAKIEKQLIQDRTKSALDARRKILEKDGYFISKSGRRCTRLGGGAMTEDARIKASEKLMRKAKANPKNEFFSKYIKAWEARNRRLTASSNRSDFECIAHELNLLGMRTQTGLEYTATRVRALWVRMKNREYLD